MKIKTIKISIKDKDVELTLDEAKALMDELGKLFPRPEVRLTNSVEPKIPFDVSRVLRLGL